MLMVRHDGSLLTQVFHDCGLFHVCIHEQTDFVDACASLLPIFTHNVQAVSDGVDHQGLHVFFGSIGSG